MSDVKIPKTIGVDELTETLTGATARALKGEFPALDLAKTGMVVSFRIWCGIPAPLREAQAIEQEESGRLAT